MTQPFSGVEEGQRVQFLDLKQELRKERESDLSVTMLVRTTPTKVYLWRPGRGRDRSGRVKEQKERREKEGGTGNR